MVDQLNLLIINYFLKTPLDFQFSVDLVQLVTNLDYDEGFIEGDKSNRFGTMYDFLKHAI